MKRFAIIVSIAIGICSILYFNFNDRISEITAPAASLLTAYTAIALTYLDTILSKDTNNTVADTQAAPVANMSIPRTIRKVFLAIEQNEGVGGRVRRSIGTPQLRNFSPFLMLDYFSIKPPAGFPDHPHRGQETITYLIKGGVDHEDFAGNKGTIESGDLQFMTAGRGIVHAEMPKKNSDGSANVGLQLWVDLPLELKDVEPRYRDLKAAEVPTAYVNGGADGKAEGPEAVDKTGAEGKVTVKVISGKSLGVDSVKDLAYTPVWILDITMAPGSRIAQPLPQGYNAFAYTLEGETYFGTGNAKGLGDEGRKLVQQHHNVVFNQEGDTVIAEVDEKAEQNGRFILIAGQPLDQPVVQYGPFVVTSKEEVYQALMDYQTHANGFERAKDWQSEIGKPLM